MLSETYESANIFVRKKVRNISLLATIAGSVIWTPPADNSKWVISQTFLRMQTHVGTNTDAPNIKLTNGTTDIVAAVDTVVTEGAGQRLAVVGDAIVDADNPLTLVCSDASNGSTTFNVEITIIAFNIHNLG